MYQRLTKTVDPDPIQVRRASCVLLALTLSFLWDAKFHPSNFGDCLPAYGALIVEAVCSSALEHTDSVLSPSLGPTMSEALSILGACVFSLPLYTLRHILVRPIVNCVNDVPTPNCDCSCPTIVTRYQV